MSSSRVGRGGGGPPRTPSSPGGAGGVRGGPPPPLPTREELTLAWADHILVRLRPLARGLYGAGRFAAV
ncbi:MAG TPA: hypothetical protein VNT56_10625, partial [Acidimicrobiales bacterium]|nr:hypothetical protein [Acidimicrobiales bacterium]